jgi:hypothetical protein
MYADDQGSTINTMIRGKGTLTKPDWSMFMKSIMGTESQNTDGTVDIGATTTVIPIKTGGDPDIGQLVYFPDQLTVSRVIAVTAGTSFTLDPKTPLPASATEDDDFICGTNWQLASEDHPYFSVWAYFDGPKKLTQIGNKTTSATFEFAVGEIVPVEFVNVASGVPGMTYESQSVTPTYDMNTKPLRVLGIEVRAVVEGTATGTPTQTETVLLTPPYDVSIGDSIIIDVGSSVYETVAISNVSGTAGGNITLTHASVSVAASATDTVYIVLNKCAKDKADTVTITVEAEMESLKCISASSGKTGQEQIGRTITLEKSVYFQSWEAFLMRDEVFGSAFMITCGSDLNNIVSFYISNVVNTEVELVSDPLMKVDITAQAVIDSVLGNDDEFVVAAF